VVPSIILSYTTDIDLSTLTTTPSENFTLNGTPNPPSTFKNTIKTDPTQAFKYQVKILSNAEKSNVDSFIKAVQSAYS